MELFPIHTRLLKHGDDLAKVFAESLLIREKDILVVSSKVVATVEGAHIDLSTMTPSTPAMEYAAKTGRSAAFCEAVLQETTRLRGKVIGSCPGAMLTEVQPDGLPSGSILIANAGLDESNTQEGTAIGWPIDPLLSVRHLRESLARGGAVGVILTDSCVHPRRIGVGAFALVVSGIEPLCSQVGKNDLFSKPLHITTEAVADQLATAANFLMGNAAQSTPAVIVRDHGLAMSEYEGWVPAMERERDLFSGLHSS